jgi:hypothetical protein
MLLLLPLLLLEVTEIVEVHSTEETPAAEENNEETQA